MYPLIFVPLGVLWWFPILGSASMIWLFAPRGRRWACEAALAGGVVSVVLLGWSVPLLGPLVAWPVAFFGVYPFVLLWRAFA